MAQVALAFPFGRGTSKKQGQEIAELRQALSRTNVALHQAYHAFNGTCEEELVESYVYEINALHARYNYLLRRIKEREESA